MRSVPVNIRIPLDLLERFEGHAEAEPDIRSLSECVRKCAELGMEVRKYRKMMGDPARAAEFRARMEELVHTEQIESWAEHLQTGQLDGIIMLLTAEKESRYRQQRFV